MNLVVQYIKALEALMEGTDEIRLDEAMCCLADTWWKLDETERAQVEIWMKDRTAGGEE